MSIQLARLAMQEVDDGAPLKTVARIYMDFLPHRTQRSYKWEDFQLKKGRNKTSVIFHIIIIQLQL